MKHISNLFLVIAIGLATAHALSGTSQGAAGLPAWPSLLPTQLDGPSFWWGLGTGFLLTLVLRTSWRDMPRRALAWLLANRGGFRLAGWGLAFVAVLYLY